jgi:hypothetical protein
MVDLDQPGIKPGDEAHALARRLGQRIEWPLKKDSVIANAVFRANSHSLNKVFGSWVAFDDAPVFIDHILLSGVEANAYAKRYKGRYVTAVFCGLHLDCLDTAYTVLAAREALPELGNPAAERLATGGRIVGLASQHFNSPKTYFEHLSVNMPRCPIRRDAAAILAAIMLTFVYQHEEGHVMKGHTDYAIATNMADDFSEATSQTKPGSLERSLHHLRELDADEWAFANVMSPLSVKYLALNYLSLSLTRRQWIWLTWVGVALAGALLGVMDQQDLGNPLSWASHPHGILRARQTLLPSRARRLAEGFGDQEYLTAFEDTVNSVVNLGRVWPQFQMFKFAFELNGPVEQTIVAFNAGISVEHKRAYREMGERFHLRQVSPHR